MKERRNVGGTEERRERGRVGGRKGDGKAEGEKEGVEGGKEGKGGREGRKTRRGRKGKQRGTERRRKGGETKGQKEDRIACPTPSYTQTNNLPCLERLSPTAQDIIPQQVSGSY